MIQAGRHIDDSSTQIVSSGKSEECDGDLRGPNKMRCTQPGGEHFGPENFDHKHCRTRNRSRCIEVNARDRTNRNNRTSWFHRDAIVTESRGQCSETVDSAQIQNPTGSGFKKNVEKRRERRCGEISSLDDTAEKYVKDLAGSPYGATTLRQLLRMSSGLTFTERYDGMDDIARLSRANAGVAGAGKPLDVLRSINDRHSQAGEKFVYAGSETDVLGRVLVAATSKNMTELTSERLWKPMGAEHDAFWRIGVDGQEQSYGAFNASLRDWARLGLLLANDGKVGTAQILPYDYLQAATNPALQPAAFKPRKATPYFGYGYQFWLMPFKERTFAMQGIHGQTVYVQPATGLVMVLASVWESASGKQDSLPYQERDALWRGVLRSLGGSTLE